VSSGGIVFHEYFVPVDRLQDFASKPAEILCRHKVNALNISIRHAMPDPDTLLNWAPVETCAFVLYHKQRTRENAKHRVAVWTRELIDSALAVGGTYYLPYQPYATPEQFHKAYPKAVRLFELKKRLDPDFRFTNALWDKYYRPWLAEPEAHDRRAISSFRAPTLSSILIVSPRQERSRVSRVRPEKNECSALQGTTTENGRPC